VTDDTPRDSIWSLMRQEPERTSAILKVAVVAPVVIMLLQVTGAMVLPLLIVGPVTAALIFVYGVVLAMLSGWMVHSADRWQVESALQARRLMASDTAPREPEPLVFTEPVPLAQAVMQSMAAPPPAPKPPAHFQQAYFRLRFHEEVMRARREGHELSVIVLQVSVPGAPDADSLERLAIDAATLASNHSKTISLGLQVDDTEFAFVLPACDRKAAKDFLSKLLQAMGNYWCNCGLAVYPENGSNEEALLTYARSPEAQGQSGRSIVGALLRRA
jgi:hypothetical protein